MPECLIAPPRRPAGRRPTVERAFFPTPVVAMRPGAAGTPPGWGAGSEGLVPTSAAPEEQPKIGSTGLGPILIVDDDRSILETIGEILESEGYPVATASNGAEALNCVEEVRPSLVLLDMRMPVLDGWGFARILRERGLRVPVLVMTAAQDARRWAEEIGADGYLAKPFDLLNLLDAVERLRG